MTSNSFIKRYSNTGPFLNLPANNYWILREESILSYLEQRGAKVPKVFIKNTQDQSITLEFVGVSFHDLFIKSSASNPIVLMECIRSATTELLKIFELGVLHLDIAARNITFDSDGSSSVYILDFAQSLSSNYVLQKPIPLIPLPNYHHPELVNALKEDWGNFFQITQNYVPDLSEKFEVDDKIFTEYWSENLAIQKLHRSLAILCHSIGQFYFEMSESPVLREKDRIFLIDLGHKLTYKDNNESRSAIEQALHDLSAYIGNLNSTRLDNVTQIPIVQRPLKKSEPRTNGDEIPGKNFESKSNNEINQTGIKSNEFDVELNDKNNLSSFKKTVFKDKLQIVFILMSWLLLIIHVYWLDLIISTLNILLPDLIIYSIFLITVFAFISMVYGFFTRNKISTIFLNLSKLLLTTQILISSFIVINFNNSLIIWAPSSIVYLITVLLMNKIKN